MLKLKREYSLFDRIPWYYGFSWDCPCMRRCIYYPLGLNIIMSILYRAVMYLQTGLKPSRLEVMKQIAWSKGVQFGIKQTEKKILDGINKVIE